MAERFHDDPAINDYLQAAHRGDTAIVIALLDSGVNVDAHEPGGATALLMASRNGDVVTMSELLERGAHPNPDGSRGYTALTHAIRRSLPGRRGRPGVPDSRPMEMLLAAGAKPNLIDAVLANDLELVRALLDGGADPDEGRRTYNGPLLMEAAGHGHVEMVELLLDHGADIDATDDLGRTSLEEADERGQREVADLLIASGARRAQPVKSRGS